MGAAHYVLRISLFISLFLDLLTFYFMYVSVLHARLCIVCVRKSQEGV